MEERKRKRTARVSPRLKDANEALVKTLMEVTEKYGLSVAEINGLLEDLKMRVFISVIEETLVENVVRRFKESVNK